MLAARPFPGDEAVFDASELLFRTLGRDDYLEAFAHHPRIGADLDALRARFAATAAWSQAEQAGAATADGETLRALQAANVAYEAQFGYLFIVCATGKSATEMLSLLEARRHNAPDVELAVAAGEQAKITRLRLARLCDE